MSNRVARWGRIPARYPLGSVMFIIWKMPATTEMSKWFIDVVYRDLVFMHAEKADATALVDLVSGEGMVVKERRDELRVTKFKVSDALNDQLYDRLDGVEALGVPGSGGLEP